MNEANEILTRKLDQLNQVLDNMPELTHVYMRRADDVLVDIARDAAKQTITRHPDWEIEKDQPTPNRATKDTTVNPWNGPGAEIPTAPGVISDETIHTAVTTLEENDVQVPPKPSEESQTLTNKKVPKKKK